MAFQARIARARLTCLEADLLLAAETFERALVETRIGKGCRDQVHGIVRIVGQHGGRAGGPVVRRRTGEAHVQVFHTGLEAEGVQIAGAFVHVIGHGIGQAFQPFRIARLAAFPGHVERQDRDRRFGHQPHRCTARRRELLDLCKVARMDRDF
jgi:hypothetical protein